MARSLNVAWQAGVRNNSITAPVPVQTRYVTLPTTRSAFIINSPTDSLNQTTIDDRRHVIAMSCRLRAVCHFVLFTLQIPLFRISCSLFQRSQGSDGCYSDCGYLHFIDC